MTSLKKLKELSDKATPGPWIRWWQSFDVHHMTGADALTAMKDIDFAVAACQYVRDLLDGSVDQEAALREADEWPTDADRLTAFVKHHEAEIAELRKALTDAVRILGRGHRGYVGDHWMRTVQVNETTIDRLRAALATPVPADDRERRDTTGVKP